MATNRVFSKEDGKLNEFTLVTARNKLYKDGLFPPKFAMPL